MHCRAHSLLQRDLKELYHSTCKGITAKPVSEDMMKWEAEIEGLQDSIWNGVTFQLTIDFTPEYNLAPPVVKFTTIPFHPNVDPHSGLPSIDFLENRDKWNTSYTLSSILLSLQVLLSNPSLEKPVNLEAAQILMKDEPTYRMIIEKLFKEHLKMSAMPKLYEKPHKLTRAIKTISFNDYYKTWSGIATSQATDQSRAPLLEDPHFMGKYYKLKKHELQNLKEWKIKFVAANFRLARERRKPHAVNHYIQRMTSIHLSPDEPPSEPEDDIDIDTKIYGPEQESLSQTSLEDNSLEEEVDNLVAWTNALDIDSLEDYA